MQSDYLQPEFYRFSEDSLKLVNFVKDISAKRVLDLCAGSGVVGIEYALLHPEIERLDFCEIQEAFLSYLEKNRSFFIKNLKGQVFHQNYEQFDSQEKYDLILANPPYFFHGRGLLSPSQEKNRCRFFMDSSFAQFLLCLSRNLKPGGCAFFLVRENEFGIKDELSKSFSQLSLDFKLERKQDFGSCCIYQLIYQP